MGRFQAGEGVGWVCNSPALALGQNSLALGQGVGSTSFAPGTFVAAPPLACMRCAKRIKASLLISCSGQEVLSTAMLHARRLKNRYSSRYSIITAASL